MTEFLDDDLLLLWEDDNEQSSSSGSESATTKEANDIDSTDILVLQKRKRTKVPRIVKNDIRRQYVKMIGNVFNNTDVGFFHSFFHTFSIDKLIFKKSCLASSVDKSKGSALAGRSSVNHITEVRDDVIFQDIHAMSCEWYLLHHLIPDEILTIEEAKILTWPGSKRSVVVIDVACEFTRLYQVNPKQYLQVLYSYIKQKKQVTQVSGSMNSEVPAEIIIENSTNLPPTVNEIASLLPDPFSAYYEKTGQHIPVLDHPSRIKFITTFRLLLDENKCIEMMEIGEKSYVPVDITRR